MTVLLDEMAGAVHMKGDRFDRASNEYVAPPATTAIRVLILEDNPSDADLMVDALVQAGLNPQWERVESPADFENRLLPGLDLILSDNSLPQFSGVQALRLVRSRGMDVPFILVSGSIGEDIAVEAMRHGADDYLLKDRMARLGEAARQALEKRRLRIEARQAQSARHESEERFRQIAENIREVFYLTNAASTEILYVSPAYENVWGRDRATLYVKPDSWIDAIHPDDRGRVIREFSEGLTPGQFDFEFRIVRPDGSIRWIHDRGFPVHDEQGTLQRITGIAEDVTERKLRDQKIEKLSRVRAVSGEINAAIIRIREREPLLQETCRIAAERGKFEMIWIGWIDAETQEIRPIAWTGFSPEAAHAVSWASISAARGTVGEALLTRSPAIRNDIAADLPGGKLREEALQKGYRSTVCLPLIVNDNVVAVIALFALGAGFFDEEELVLLNEMVGNISFALHAIEKQEKLEYLSYFDLLTGLPNRHLFVDRLGQQIRSRGREAPMVALIVIDIERFRNINQTFGHRGGDELLKAIAQRLEHVFHTKDYLARVSSNGFGVIVRGMKDAGDIVRVLEHEIFASFMHPFTVSDRELRVSAKGGIALFPADGEDADTLFRNAESALKRAKSSGDHYLFFSADMNAQALHAVALETRLRKAVDAEQFVLHYQPKVDLAMGRICGLEALIRWNDPESGLMAPAMFIPLLEETGMILDVGRWAMRKAVAEYRAWCAQGLQPPRIAVNVSPIQLRQKDFVDVVREVIGGPGAGPHGLDLEITESLIMEDIEGNVEKLRAVKGMDINIAVDDFGTGYSSLAYLAQLPVHALKIDRSFINTMAESPNSMTIVSTIISLAHALDLKVIAEGVETTEQSKFLRLFRCDEIQGYLIAKPVPAAEIAAMLGQVRVRESNSAT